MSNSSVNIKDALNGLGKANNLLKTVLHDDVLNQMSDDQKKEIEKALTVSDSKSLKEKALKLTKIYS